MKARDLLMLKAELKIHSNAELQRRLGVSETAFRRWMNEPDRDLPRYFALAGAALLAGLEPYRPGDVSPEEMAYYGKSTARKVFGTAPLTHEEDVKSRMALIPPDA